MSTEVKNVVRHQNLVVITPAQESQQDDLAFSCPVCDSLITTDDWTAWRKFQCCTDCADMWAYKYQKKWQEGWRPSLEQVKEIATKKMTHVIVGAI